MISLVKLLGHLLLAVLSLAWRAVVVATPLLGVWLASSLIAFVGGPREAALVGGVLLFPLIPLLWEARAARRFARKLEAAKAAGKDEPRHLLKTVDRVVLRTLFVNGLFLGALLAAFPRPAFTALATRGDWFLDGRQDAVSEQIRTGLFAAASGLEWLHELANPNPYKKEGDDKVPVPDDVKPVDEKTPTGDKTPPDPTKPPVPPKPEAEGTWVVGDTHWPHAGKIHPVVVDMPASAETSISAVATYIATREPDPFLRAKALHDWVVTRLHYDHDSVTGVRKAQDAESVFRNRMGVCEGYARLLVELGKYAGIPIVYVVGEIREDDGQAAPVGHAWNAAQVKGQWYFMDATWDDPSSAGDTNPAATDNYRTDYLFTPPSVAIFDHLPDDARWQLLAQPLDRGAFLRQPMARPGFAKLGLGLVSPVRPTVDATGFIDVVIDNPRGLPVQLIVAPHGTTTFDAKDACPASGTTQLRARCALPAPGRYDVAIFAGARPGRATSFEWVANLSVNNR